MLRLAKAFWDISLWRRTPEQLPASLFLLSLVAGAAALLEVLSALQPPISIPQMFARMVLSVGLPLAFVWVALLLAHRPHRFLQTSIAVLGVDVLAGLILYPIGSLMHFIGPDQLHGFEERLVTDIYPADFSWTPNWLAGPKADKPLAQS